VTQPCRTFQQAYNTVPANGEIDVLDPAGYGPLVISKSIKVQGHGVAGISAASGANGIYITAGEADRVVLQGLIIEGGGVADGGIYSQTVGSLAVEDCEIRDFTTGIFVTGNLNNNTNLFVSNTRVANSQNGVYVWPGPPESATATLTRVEVSGATNGITARADSADTLAIIYVADSVVANSINGAHVLAPAASYAGRIWIMRSQILVNGNAINAAGGPIAVAGSLLAGMLVTTGFSYSYGDNAGPVGNTFDQTIPHF
jgi:hypothetical protein